jgi:tRNA A-37 threonylcarbamoyl transferase component Bud32
MRALKRYVWRLFLRLHAADLVKTAYRGLLGREPDPEGLAAHSATLAATQELAAFLADVIRSDEFLQKSFTALAPDLVRAAYRGLLGREPDPEGLAAHIASLAKKQDLAVLLANFVRSGEFSRSRANLQPCPNPAASYDSPTVVSPLGSETTHATFFRDLFTAATETEAGVSKDDLLARARHRAEAIAKSQQDYQPFYGLPGEKQQSARRDNLLISVALVRDHFAQISMKTKTKVRVLDVGCNAGFVSFSLAETFPLTRGIDISPEHIALCKDLAVYTGSSARFAECDILQVMETGNADLENVDCVLLLNIVHQFIFAKGIPYVRTFLARLADCVDVIVVELARKEEYKRLNQDHLLPEDPATILSNIRNCNIHLVKSAGRPLYKITRQNAVFGRLSVPIVRFRYSDSPALHENRKYYIGNGRFLKVFRFTQNTTPVLYYREVRALLALTGTISVPQILDWTITPTYGAIMMEETPGDLLPQSFKKFSSHHGIIAFVREYLGVAALLAKEKLYHNDMSAHNIVVLPTGGVRFIDFGQADTLAYQDPFAVMLWTIYDILSEDIASYKQSVYKQLSVKSGSERVSQEHYPDFSQFDLSPTLSELLSSAKTHNSWFTFAAEWSDRLAAPQNPAAPLVDKSGSQRTGS